MKTNTTYDSLLDTVLAQGTVTIKTTNPKAVRTGIQKARTTYNELADMMGMPTENRRIVVAAVPNKANTYTVSIHTQSTFEIVEPEIKNGSSETTTGGATDSG